METHGVLSCSKQLTVGSARARVEAIEHIHSWLGRTNDLLTRLFLTLSGIIETLNRIMSEVQTHIEFTGLIAAFRQSVQEMIKELEEVREGLQNVRTRCDNFRTDVSVNSLDTFGYIPCWKKLKVRQGWMAANCAIARTSPRDPRPQLRCTPILARERCK